MSARSDYAVRLSRVFPETIGYGFVRRRMLASCPTASKSLCDHQRVNIPGVWKPRQAETQEQFVGRLKFKRNRGYVGVAMTSVLDLYEHIDALERRVVELEAKCAGPN
jgi:hypothetical protein